MTNKQEEVFRAQFDDDNGGFSKEVWDKIRESAMDDDGNILVSDLPSDSEMKIIEDGLKNGLFDLDDEGTKGTLSELGFSGWVDQLLGVNK